MATILGISAYDHDAAACLVRERKKEEFRRPDAPEGGRRQPPDR